MTALPRRGLRRGAPALLVGALVLYAAWAVFPIAWVLLTSLKTNAEALSVPPRLLFAPTLSNYANVFATVYDFPEVALNSVLIAGAGSAIIILLALPAAYGLSRLIPIGRNAMGFGIISARTFPTIGLAIPLFIMMQNADLLDTRVSVIVANVAYSLPFGIWMILGFVEAVPIELEEAAMLDGCSRVGALIRVVMPQLLPGLGATAILTSIVAWREYLFPLVLTSRDARTLPVVAGSFITDSGTDWGGLCAYAVMTIVPIAIFCAVAGKFLVRGFIAGAVKG
jgi:ABC-type glycerol-3-phosphate transport system permease component